MKLDAYAVHDAAVGAFNRPMFFRSRGEAVRSFQDAVRDPQSGFGSHGTDYSWWFIGQFDDSDGSFTAVKPERVCGALDYILPPTAE